MCTVERYHIKHQVHFLLQKDGFEPLRQKKNVRDDNKNTSEKFNTF